MRTVKTLQALSAAAAMALLTGCSGNGVSAIAPQLSSPQTGPRFLNGHVPDFLTESGVLNINARASRIASHDSCPLLGPIKYVSDPVDSVIDVFAGKFAGQAPCGQITSGLNEPLGLYVEPITHDLYVANFGDRNILVFHRDQMDPYNAYVDPSSQKPADVTVAKDGTVIASNGENSNNEQAGSISTWFRGPNGGVWIGNFSMVNGGSGSFITVQKNGKVFYDNHDPNTGQGTLWALKCPIGRCGKQTEVAGVSITAPTGLGSDGKDDLIVADVGQPSLIETFKLPNPQPSTFPVTGSPSGVAINPSDDHVFIADEFAHGAGPVEYLYPSGVLVGTTVTLPSTFGIAVDPGHAP